MISGNPIRLTMVEQSQGLTPSQARAHFGLKADTFTLLVFGGSRGAESINRAILEACKFWQQAESQHDAPLQILHIAGERDFTWVEAAYQNINIPRQVLPYCHDMHWAYAAADLVLSRAGATTLAELTALGKASILVPFPHAINNHQEHNARLLAAGGAARMILNQDLNGELLAQAVLNLMVDEVALARMRENSGLLGRPMAAKIIADMIEALGLDMKNLARGSRRTVNV